jgi:ABC-type glutathione transport system ATPase component
LFITHDLGVVSVAADRVLVLERGAICESGLVADVLRAPSHRYTRRLLDAAPTLADLRSPSSDACPTSLTRWRGSGSAGLDAASVSRGRQPLLCGPGSRRSTTRYCRRRP